MNSVDVRKFLFALAVGTSLLVSQGCTELPYASPSQADLEAFDAVDFVWERSGRRVGRCHTDDRSRIRVLEGTQDEVREWCRAGLDDGVVACVWSGRDGLLSPVITTIAIASDPGDSGHPPISARTRASLMAHEYAHILRGCWVHEASPEEFQGRFWAGRSDPDCRFWTAQDPGHCDRYQWTTLHNLAMMRWEEHRD